MLYALILVSAALVAALAVILFGPRAKEDGQAVAARLDAESKARHKAEHELEKRRKELEEQRAALNGVKEELRQTKRKLFDQAQGGEPGRELARERADVERQASIQLEIVRAELAQAQTELERLRADARDGRRPKGVVSPPPTVPAAPALEAPAVPEPRRFRELNDADREKIERAEASAKADRARAAELDRELKRVKAKADTQSRIYLVTKGELELIKDKYKALEKRLNRTLLEADLMKRAISALEKHAGVSADRTALTVEEASASDRQVDERAAEEAAQASSQRAELEAPPAAPAEVERS